MPAAAPALKPLSWFAGRAALTVIGAAALCALPAWLWTGREGLVSLAVALAICGVGALAGRLAQQQVFERTEGPQRAVNAMLAGLGVRMFATLGPALGVIVARPFELMPFAVWLLVGYVLLLCLEVFVALREFGQNHGPSRTEDASSEVSEGNG